MMFNVCQRNLSEKSNSIEKKRNHMNNVNSSVSSHNNANNVCVAAEGSWGGSGLCLNRRRNNI